MPLCDQVTIQATNMRNLHANDGPVDLTIRAGVESNGVNFVPVIDFATGSGSYRFYLTGPRAIALSTVLCELGNDLAANER